MLVIYNEEKLKQTSPASENSVKKAYAGLLYGFHLKFSDFQYSKTTDSSRINRQNRDFVFPERGENQNVDDRKNQAVIVQSTLFLLTAQTAP